MRSHFWSGELKSLAVSEQIAECWILDLCSLKRLGQYQLRVLSPKEKAQRKVSLRTMFAEEHCKSCRCLSKKTFSCRQSETSKFMSC